MFNRKKNATQTEWIEVVRQGQDLIKDRSGIETIFLRMNNEVETAHYQYRTETIEMSPKYSFGEHTTPDAVAKIGFDTEEAKEQWPAAVGVLMHETFHARFGAESQIRAQRKLEETDRFAGTLLELLEESRIERKGAEMFPKDRPFLRASSIKLVLSSHEREQAEKEGKQQMQPVLLYTLIGPRVNGGILKKKDAAPVLNAMKDVLSDEHKGYIDEAGEEFFKLGHEDREAVRIAKDLADKLRSEDPFEKSDQEQKAMQEAMKNIMEILKQMGNRTESEVQKEARPGGQGEPKETPQQQQKRHKKEAQESQQFFGAGNVRGRTNSRKEKSRNPTAAERRAANEIARILKRARYKDRKKSVVHTELPPGRLNTSAAMQKKANPGMRVDRWSEVRRTHVEQPRLHLGLLADVSGSMDRAMEPMGAASWIFSNVIKEVEGEAATVYYGQGTIPVMKPGEVQRQVDIWEANDGGHVIGDAFKMLNGALRISEGTGARLLVVISDAHYQSRETNEAEEAIKACLTTGAGVVWMDLSDSSAAKSLCERTGARYIGLSGPITEAAKIIGEECKAALEAVAPE